MKKLMIAAAIVCAAAMSQAATCYWNAQNTSGCTIYGMGTDEAIADCTAYLFCESVIDQETLWNSIYNNEATLSDMVSTYKAKAASVADGKLTTTPFTTDATVGQKYPFYLVIQDGDNYLISESTKGTATDQAVGTPLKFDVETESGDKDYIFGNVAYTGDGGWYSVPEPTSGLLLLLGVAGLALRRRRA